MRIVFWQNILSHLQIPYITHLADDNDISEIVIAVGESISKDREKMGWNTSHLSKSNIITVYINPDFQTINNILQKDSENSYHLFSGIRGFSFVYNAFKNSLNYNVKRGIITERPLTYAFGLPNGKPLWIHKIRFYLQDKKYISYINSVFAIGEDAVNYYKSISDSWKVYPFAYCTQYSDNTSKTYHQDMKVRFIFIGGLIKRKSVKSILQANKIIMNKKTFSITIIGDGKERMILQKYTNKHQLNNICFTGTKANSEISNILEEHDILILPSLHDGWGAVINEALMQGKYVICSDKCGAKELLKNTLNGIVFKSEDHNDLANKMLYCIHHINTIREQEQSRREWAENHIGGKVIAQYMLNCLQDKNNKAPWIE